MISRRDVANVTPEGGTAVNGLSAASSGSMSRRVVLRWLVGGTVGAGAGAFFGGVGPWAGAVAPPGRRLASPYLATGGRSGSSAVADKAAVPQLVAAPTRATKDGTQVFMSRPDLQPPIVTIDVPSDAAALPGLVLTNSSAGPSQQGALMIDGSGDLVWFLPSSAASNVRAQTYKGKPIVSWFEGEIVDGHGEGHYELYDTTYQQVAQVYASGDYQGDLHEFLLTASGSALFTCYGQATADLSSVGGANEGSYYYGVVQEVDVATGDLLFQWRSDDHVGFDESYVAAPESGGTPWDYFHINSIDVDPTDGNLIVSSRHCWAAYKVDRASGAIIWRLNGKKSDFTMGAGAHFAFQHDVRRHLDGGVTIFDDEGGPPNEATQSRGLVLDLDETSRQATVNTEYHHLPPVLTQALGSIQVLGQGHHFVGWGESSYFTEYDASGKVVFDGHLTSGVASYRAFKEPWAGWPAGNPDTAVATGLGTGTAIVYVSWNGATEVDSWSVLGGTDAQELAVLGVASRAGFETAITVPQAPAYLAVEALDSGGHVLGRSSVVSFVVGDAR